MLGKVFLTTRAPLSCAVGTDARSQKAFFVLLMRKPCAYRWEEERRFDTADVARKMEMLKEAQNKT